ncbi:glycosyltransferase family 2 protein [Devosia aurantiaca]|uniref:Glycosyltransferase family 2 protein n=1 Tax=Devosia aurantiaca TaxID=2714858 RepID=A0A6M1SN59_9HYPH|nr:glycosyltransferase family A protein [Devosia aurantiaca]NGP18560.1 glycosyltransferase family 2 protein [Devosia aurantiaca]
MTGHEEQTLITIAIACFNAHDTIERSIRSAQALDWPALEILVVDDASTDKSLALVRQLSASDNRIRVVVHNINLGTGATRTRLVQEARGEFIAFLDDDDVCRPSRLRDQISALRRAEQQSSLPFIACYGSRRIIGQTRNPRGAAIASDGEVLQGEAVALAILTGLRPSTGRMGRHGSCTLLARRGTFMAVGDFDPLFRRHQDTDWAIRLALMGGGFIGTSEIVLDQYITPSSDKNDKLVHDLALALRRKHRIFLQSRGYYRLAIARAEMNYFNSAGPKWRFRLAVLKAFLLAPTSFCRNGCALKTESGVDASMLNKATP